MNIENKYFDIFLLLLASLITLSIYIGYAS